MMSKDEEMAKLQLLKTATANNLYFVLKVKNFQADSENRVFAVENNSRRLPGLYKANMLHDSIDKSIGKKDKVKFSFRLDTISSWIEILVNVEARLPKTLKFNA